MILSVIAVIAGMINGIFGTGGGIIIIFMLNHLLEKDEDHNNDEEMFKKIMVITMISVIPMSVISAVIYFISGIKEFKLVLSFLPGAVIGGICGAFLMNKFNVKIIKNVFAVTVIYAGIKMFFK